MIVSKAKKRHRSRSGARARRQARCKVCGEDDVKLHRLVVTVDGKMRHQEQLCRCCLAVKLVGLADDRLKADTRAWLLSHRGPIHSRKAAKG